MKRFNYYYNGQIISKDRFLQGVPKDWENDIDEYGEYSYGYFRAIEVDEG